MHKFFLRKRFFFSISFTDTSKNIKYSWNIMVHWWIFWILTPYKISENSFWNQSNGLPYILRGVFHAFKCQPAQLSSSQTPVALGTFSSIAVLLRLCGVPSAQANLWPPEATLLASFSMKRGGDHVIRKTSLTWLRHSFVFLCSSYVFSWLSVMWIRRTKFRLLSLVSVLWKPRGKEIIMYKMRSNDDKCYFLRSMILC